MTPIKLRRLQDVAVKGNFTINCETSDEIHMLHDFFWTEKSAIKFKDIQHVPTKMPVDKIIHEDKCTTVYTMGLKNDPNRKFVIKFETLAELLKLRELFRVRSSKFDMYLIKKRGYNMFTTDFYKQCENTDIQRVRK